MVRDFCGGCQFEDLGQDQLKQVVSRVSQLITSIPDKARQGPPTSLSPRLFFKRITTQLFHGMVEWDDKLVEESSFANDVQKNSGILFVGEAIARICRRGYTGELLRDVIPLILGNIRIVLKSSSGVAINEFFASQPVVRFWLKLMEGVNDSHSVERIAEELLHQLAVQNVNSVKGHWFLWILFGRFLCNKDLYGLQDPCKYEVCLCLSPMICHSNTDFKEPRKDKLLICVNITLAKPERNLDHHAIRNKFYFSEVGAEEDGE